MKLSYLYAKAIQKIRGVAVINSSIHPTVVICPGSNISNSIMGRYSYCGYDCKFDNVEIGAFCSISDHVFIGGAEHPIEWVSTSPVFQNTSHSGPKRRFAKIDVPIVKKTIVGNDVWIGHGVSIKQGVTIGHGAVVGSNALVTKDIPPYAVVGGVPAKIIKYRFSNDLIAELLQSEWWNNSEEIIEENAELIRTPRLFLERVGRNKGL